MMAVEIHQFGNRQQQHRCKNSREHSACKCKKPGLKENYRHRHATDRKQHLLGNMLPSIGPAEHLSNLLIRVRSMVAHHHNIRRKDGDADGGSQPKHRGCREHAGEQKNRIYDKSGARNDPGLPRKLFIGCQLVRFPLASRFCAYDSRLPG